MKPGELREYLAVLREAGVAKATFLGIQVEFEDRLVPISGLMDAEGKAIDLDAGLPPLARDDYDSQAIDRANFPSPRKGQS